jgi:multisubunit Na+/H+ antiporter MnhC subunit
MLKVNILQQNKIKRLLRFGLYTTAVFAVIFYITTNTIFIPHIISSFVYGVLLGVLEEISNHRRILALSLPLQFLFKIVGILLVFTLFSGALIFTISSLTEIHVPDLIKQMQSRQLASPIISALAVAFVISTIFSDRASGWTKSIAKLPEGKISPAEKGDKGFSIYGLAILNCHFREAGQPRLLFIPE